MSIDAQAGILSHSATSLVDFTKNGIPDGQLGGLSLDLRLFSVARCDFWGHPSPINVVFREVGSPVEVQSSKLIRKICYQFWSENPGKFLR